MWSRVRPGWTWHSTDRRVELRGRFSAGTMDGMNKQNTETIWYALRRIWLRLAWPRYGVRHLLCRYRDCGIGPFS
jgi:hypothetical protein